MKNHVVAGQLCCLCLSHPGFDFYSRAHDCFEQYRYALSIVRLSLNPAHQASKWAVQDRNSCSRFQTSRSQSDQTVLFNAVTNFLDNRVMDRDRKFSATHHTQNAARAFNQFA